MEDSILSEGGAVVSNAVTSASAPILEKKRRSVAVQKPSKPPLVYPGREHVERVMQFLREVRVELRKVTWPSRKQTVGSTVVVIVLVMLLSLFLGVVDVGLSGLAKMVLQ